MPPTPASPRWPAAVSLVALVVAAVALFRAMTAPAPSAPEPDATPHAASAPTPTVAPAPLAPSGADPATRAALDALLKRLARVEGRVGLGPRAPGDDGADVGSPAPEPAKAPAAAPEQRRVHDELRAKILSGEATDAERTRFWILARSLGTVDEVVAELEKAVAGSPEDVSSRMRLADGYVARLIAAPDGPEKGLWAAKAETQWKEVLARDGTHWDARFDLAFAYSQYPDFLNKTPDAIREFETLRRTQEGFAPEARHAQTYLQLANAYRKQGALDKAKEALAAGLARHPDDAELKKALDASGK